MAYVDTRPDGKFIGRYRDSLGRKQSAGTYESKAEALAAAKALEGKPDDLPAGITLRQFVDNQWLTHAALSKNTINNYMGVYRNHIDPVLGNRRVNSIKRFEVRMLLKEVMNKGLKPITADHVKTVLASIYKTLLELDLVESNPTLSIHVKGKEAKQFELVEPSDFKKIAEHLPNFEAKLFAEVLVRTGMRFGEATELRPSDINFRTDEITISRHVVSLSNSGASRFVVEPGTKSGKNRTITVSSDVSESLQAHIKKFDLGPNDLIFGRSIVSPKKDYVLEAIVVVSPEGEETFEKDGKTYTHGTTVAYCKAGCRCEYCRAASTAYARTRRQVRTKQQRTNFAKNITGHLPNDLWNRVWKKACKDSGIGWQPRTHDLRHAHATHLVENGVDIYEVKERLGHSSVTTTEVYKHITKRRQSKAANIADDFKTA
jgi:integrase